MTRFEAAEQAAFPFLRKGLQSLNMNGMEAFTKNVYTMKMYEENPLRENRRKDIL